MPTKILTLEEADELKKQGFIYNEGDEIQYQDAPQAAPQATSGATPLGSGGRAVLANLLPAIAGGATMGAISGSFAPGPGNLIGAIVGGILASKGAGMAQEAIMPESWKAQLAADIAENPKSTMAGGMVSGIAGGMMPGMTTVKAGTGLARAIFNPKTLEQTEIDAMKMAGMGAGLGAGTELAMAPIEGRPITATGLAESAGMGALYSHPTPGIGRLFGFHAPQARGLENVEQGRGNQKLSQDGVEPMFKIKADANREKAYTSPEQKQFYENMFSQNLTPKLSKAEASRQIAHHYDLTGKPVGLDPGAIDPRTGKPVMGYTTGEPGGPRNIGASIGEGGIADVAVIAHEGGGHVAWEHLPAAEKAAFEFNSKAELDATNKFRAERNMDPMNVEELYATKLGHAVATRAYRATGEGMFTKLGRDIQAGWMNKKPTTEQYMRNKAAEYIRGKTEVGAGPRLKPQGLPPASANPATEGTKPNDSHAPQPPSIDEPIATPPAGEPERAPVATPVSEPAVKPTPITMKPLGEPYSPEVMALAEAGVLTPEQQAQMMALPPEQLAQVQEIQAQQAAQRAQQAQQAGRAPVASPGMTPEQLAAATAEMQRPSSRIPDVVVPPSTEVPPSTAVPEAMPVPESAPIPESTPVPPATEVPPATPVPAGRPVAASVAMPEAARTRTATSPEDQVKHLTKIADKLDAQIENAWDDYYDYRKRVAEGKTSRDPLMELRLKEQGNAKAKELEARRDEILARVEKAKAGAGRKFAEAGPKMPEAEIRVGPHPMQYWMAPSGKAEYAVAGHREHALERRAQAEFGGDVDRARKALSRYDEDRGETISPSEDTYGWMEKQGYTRVVTHGKHIIAEGRLNSAQARTLKDAAIEKGLTFSVEGPRGLRTIYDPTQVFAEGGPPMPEAAVSKPKYDPELAAQHREETLQRALSGTKSEDLIKIVQHGAKLGDKKKGYPTSELKDYLATRNVKLTPFLIEHIQDSGVARFEVDPSTGIQMVHVDVPARGAAQGWVKKRLAEMRGEEPVPEPEDTSGRPNDDVQRDMVDLGFDADDVASLTWQQLADKTKTNVNTLKDIVKQSRRDETNYAHEIVAKTYPKQETPVNRRKQFKSELEEKEKAHWEAHHPIEATKLIDPATGDFYENADNDIRHLVNAQMDFIAGKLGMEKLPPEVDRKNIVEEVKAVLEDRGVLKSDTPARVQEPTAEGPTPQTDAPNFDLNKTVRRIAGRSIKNTLKHMRGNIGEGGKFTEKQIEEISLGEMPVDETGTMTPQRGGIAEEVAGESAARDLPISQPPPVKFRGGSRELSTDYMEPAKEKTAAEIKAEVQAELEADRPKYPTVEEMEARQAPVGTEVLKSRAEQQADAYHRAAWNEAHGLSSQSGGGGRGLSMKTHAVETPPPGDVLRREVTQIEKPVRVPREFEKARRDATAKLAELIEERYQDEIKPAHVKEITRAERAKLDAEIARLEKIRYTPYEPPGGTEMIKVEAGLSRKVKDLLAEKEADIKDLQSGDVTYGDYINEHVRGKNTDLFDWAQSENKETYGFKGVDPLNRHYARAESTPELIEMMQKDIEGLKELQARINLKEGEMVNIHDLSLEMGRESKYTATELEKKFGKSVLKDEKGKPLELYRSEPYGGAGESTQQLIGDAFARTGEGRKYHVRIENPATMKDVYEITGGKPITHKNAEEVKGRLIEKGFDGIVDDTAYPPIVPFRSERMASFPAKRAATERTNYRFAEAGPAMPEALPPVERGLKWIEGTFDAVNKVNPELGRAFRSWGVWRDKYHGWGTDTLERLKKFDDTTLEQVVDNMHEARDTDVKPDTLMDTPEQREAYEVIKDYFYNQIGQERRNIEMNFEGRQPGKRENYFPEMLDKNILKAMRDDPNGPVASRAREQWIDHIVEVSKKQETGDFTRPSAVGKDEAAKMVDDYMDALGEASSHYFSTHFGAIRKPEGYGLPPELRDTNVKSVIGRYANRAATDMSMFRNLEKPNSIRSLLGLKDPRTGEESPMSGVTPVKGYQEVRNAMQFVTGKIGAREQARKHPLIAALTRLANSGVIGPLSTVRDISTIPATMTPYIERMSDLGAIGRGLANMKAMSLRAMRVGATTRMADRHIFGDVDNAHSKLVSMINKGSDWLRVGQGREHGERYGREALFSIGMELGKNNILAAKRGEASAKKWLSKFDVGIEGDITKLEGQALEDALDLVGKNFVDRNQGSYGGAELPHAMVDSQFAPFFALRKWGVEKANVIKKDVIDEAARGNVKPLLMYGLSTVMTGAAIEKIAELAQGKKSQEPTVGEVVASGSAEDYAAKLVSLMQMGSAGGILGDVAKMGMQSGVYSQLPQDQLSMPLVSGIGDAITRFNHAFEAAKNGDDKVQLTMQLIQDIAKKNIQIARLVMGHIKDEQSERQDKFRDVRAFKALEGEPLGSFAQSNQYIDRDIKDWKKETDPVKAAQQMQAIIRRRLDQGMSPDDLRQKIRGMKAMSYQTMPNPKNDPIGFRKFYTHLVETQGKEAADDRVHDFLLQNARNKAKSAMLPDFSP